MADDALKEYPPRRFNTLLNVVEPGHQVVVTFLGSRRGTRKEGFFVALPFLHTLVDHDMRVRSIPIDEQEATTRDNVRVWISGVLFAQVVDSERATFEVASVLYAATQQAKAAMRRIIGGFSLDESFRSRGDINKAVDAAIGPLFATWGLATPRYEITNIVPDERVSEALDLTAIAERRRRENEQDSMAHKRAAELVSEGERTRAENEALGRAFSVKQDADARAHAVVAAAEADAKSVALASEAQASAIARIAASIATPQGAEAARIGLAEHYTEALAEFGRKGTTAVFSKDLSNLPALISTGLGVASAVAQGREK